MRELSKGLESGKLKVLARVGRMLMAVREGFVFCQEKNEDETITIVKYKIDANSPSRD